MGGDIHVSSKVGEGSTFSFYVVLQRTSRKSYYAANREGVEGESRAQLEGKKVLLAEDNKMNQVLIRKMLEEMGCNCDTADDGQLAVAKAVATKYDFILMDYLMPNMNGIEATKLIRNSSALNAQVPIFALSASSDMETRNLLISSGLTNFISKPVTLMQLRLALETFFDERPRSLESSVDAEPGQAT